MLRMIRILSQKAHSDNDQKDNNAIISTVLKVTSQWCNKKRKQPEKRNNLHLILQSTIKMFFSGTKNCVRYIIN
jgi:hypothetical protein